MPLATYLTYMSKGSPPGSTSVAGKAEQMGNLTHLMLPAGSPNTSPACQAGQQSWAVSQQGNQARPRLLEARAQGATHLQHTLCRFYQCSLQHWAES